MDGNAFAGGADDQIERPRGCSACPLLEQMHTTKCIQVHSGEGVTELTCRILWYDGTWDGSIGTLGASLSGRLGGRTGKVVTPELPNSDWSDLTHRKMGGLGKLLPHFLLITKPLPRCCSISSA